MTLCKFGAKVDALKESFRWRSYITGSYLKNFGADHKQLVRGGLDVKVAFIQIYHFISFLENISSLNGLVARVKLVDG